MSRYILERLLWLVVIIVAVVFIIFTLMYFVPGDIALMTLGTTATEEELFNYREQFGLNDTYIEQLGRYLSDIFLHLDFGTSYVYKTPVIQEFASRVPRTLALGLIGIFVNIIVAVPLGVSCALHRNSAYDHIMIAISMVLISAPGFWLALMMILLFSKTLGWLPTSGIGTWKHWVMPVIATALPGIGMFGRQIRSAVLETMRADFVTTAKAKGLSPNVVTYKHMLPNAIIPIITMFGGRVASMMAGTTIIENVFSFPGVGTYLLTGIQNRDYPVVRGCVIVLGCFSAIVHLLVDLMYAYVDPRIKAQYSNYHAKKKA